MCTQAWDLRKCSKPMKTFTDSHFVMRATFNPEQPDVFATASLSQAVRIWSLNESRPLATFWGHSQGVCSLCWARCRTRQVIISTGDDYDAIIWDATTPVDNTGKVVIAHPEPVTWWEWFFAATTLPRILYTPAPSSNLMTKLSSHTHNVSCVTVVNGESSPFIVTGSEDHNLRCWDPENFGCLSNLNPNLGRLWAVATIPGTNVVVAGGDNGVSVMSVRRK